MSILTTLPETHRIRLFEMNPIRKQVREAVSARNAARPMPCVLLFCQITMESPDE